jgi:ATP-dependent DNA helicase DinG
METNDFFGEGGMLAEELEGFRPRQGQTDLAEAVKNAIEKKRHLIAEAPTGTGKSMAYGIPTAVNTVEYGTTAVIATANITLQEQLVQKDLPIIKKVIQRCMPDDASEAFNYFEYVLVKGMSNYLCLLGLEEAEDENGSDDWYREILKWSRKTGTGDKSELAVEYPSQIWSKVSTSSDDCLRKNCPHYDGCFVFKARRASKQAHIIVTNYHMLFTDVLVRNMSDGNASLLPDYDLVIMDEAHEVADIAMDFQGFQLTPSKMRWAVKALTKIPNSEDAQRMMKHAYASVDGFFAVLERAARQGRIVDKPIGEDGGICKSFRMVADFMQRFAKDNVDAKASDKAASLKARLVMAAGLCRKRAREIEEFCYGVRPPEELKIEIKETEKKMRGQIPLFPKEEKEELDALKEELRQGPKFPKGYVYYFEEGERQLALCAKVVTPQAFLRENFFEQKTVIMTSATLSTGGDFDFLAKEVGLTDDEYDGLIVPSPFDPEQVLSVIPNESFPSVDSREFTGAVAEVVAEVSANVPGGVMALFTSYRNLNEVRGSLATLLQPDIHLYVQGEMPKGRIIEHFKRDFDEGRKALILATASFWQGVDIAGQALSVVIIDKVPFARPDDPVMHYLERIGESAFFDYSVPKAVIALKQGVGRLIRRETDFWLHRHSRYATAHKELPKDSAFSAS